MFIAITRGVSPAMVNCELTFVARAPIDLTKAVEQHRAYEQVLEKFGAKVISLPAEPALADSMFVEDPAMVLDELALIFPLGTESRRAEAPSLAKALSQFRELKHVQLPGTAEGGDMLRVGRNLFSGLSKRTNEDGIRQLQSVVGEYGYTVTAVPVSGCLHLKSAVTFLGRNTLLANREWFTASCMSGFEWIDVAPEEPHAANALAFGDTVILPRESKHGDLRCYRWIFRSCKKRNRG
jgi:dimethylargininase